MSRLLLIAALCLAAASPAFAQSPQDCLPDLDVLLFGPTPLVLPQPLVAAAPQERAAPQPAPHGLLRPAAPRAATPGARRGVRARGTAAAGDCPTLTRYQEWDGTAWSPDDQQTTATYDAAGRPLVITERGDLGTGLADLYRTRYTYDASGTPTEILTDTDFDRTGQFQPLSRERYTTDASGRILTLAFDEWNGSAWEPNARVTVLYASGPYASSFLTEAFVDGAWQPSYRGTIAYTPAGLRQTLVYETWDGAAWSLDERETWAYDAGRATSRITEYNGGMGGLVRLRTLVGYVGTRITTLTNQEGDGAGGWTDSSRETFAYDGSGRLTSDLIEIVDPNGGFVLSSRTLYTQTASGLAAARRETWDGAAWTPDGRTLDTRTAAGTLTERVFQFWEGGVWVNSSRLLYQYTGTTAGENGPAAALRLLGAPRPNPAHTLARVAFTLAAAGPARLAVVDLLGREVAVAFDGVATAGETSVSVDVAALSPGVYVLRLVAGAQTATQRLAVVR